MENFIVSARKYRPASFDMVVGQDAITQTLKNAIVNKHLAQAYLFCGPRGVGKTTCARIFAKTINCFHLKENAEACDECESCMAFNASRSFNIHELDAASNNKVDNIRTLNDQVRIPPQVGKYSIYIIDEVHMLSSSAFNAFLKTLEEPPAHAIFILATTEKHKIIPTILSRCQIFDFNRIRVEDIISRLKYVAEKESVTAEEEALHVIAHKADGAMRDALSIFDQMVSLCGKNICYREVIENLNVLDYEYYFRVVDAILRSDVSTALVILDEIINKGFDEYNFLTGLNSHLRDLLVSKDEVTAKLLETSNAVRQRYVAQAARCSMAFLYKALDIGGNYDINYKNTKNTRLHVELALVKLCSLLSSKEKQEETTIKNNIQSGILNTGETVSRINIRRSGDNQVKSNVRSSGQMPSLPTDSALVKPSTPKMSMKDLMANPVVEESKDVTPKNHSDTSINTAVDENPVPSNLSAEKIPVNNENISAVWKEFINVHSGEGSRVMSMFHSMKPVLEKGNTVVFTMSNIDQKNMFIQNYRLKLLNLFENKFADNVDIQAVVSNSDKEEMLYTDEQKYNYLVEKYPIIRDFQKRLTLDY